MKRNISVRIRIGKYKYFNWVNNDGISTKDIAVSRSRSITKSNMLFIIFKYI